MPAAVAIPLITAGVTGATGLIGAGMQSGAASDAAALNAQAQQKIADENAATQKYIAELQADSTQKALDFSKANAENAYQNSEVARAGNYDLYAASQARIGSIAKLLGFGDRVIPAYRPGVDPNFTGSSSGPSKTATLPNSFGNLSDPSTWMGLVADPSKLSTFVKSVAPNMDPGLVNYYVQKIQGQPGANPTEQAGSAQYWANKIINDPTLATAPKSSPQPVTPPISVAGLVNPTTAANPAAVTSYVS